MKLKTIITAYDITPTSSLTPEQVPINIKVGSEGVKADPVERQDEIGVDVIFESAATGLNGSSTSSSIEEDVTVGADAITMKPVAYSKQVITYFSLAGLEEAPIDGNQYIRKDGGWEQVETITDKERQQIKDNTSNIATNTENIEANTVKIAEATTAIRTLQDNCLTDAPSDGKQYVRKDGEWVEVSGGGGGSIEWDD